MSKRYTTVIDGESTTYSRKDAALRAGESSGKPFQLLSPTGTVLIDTTPYTTKRDFPGNYSGQMIQFTRDIADAFEDVEVEEQRFPGKLVRRAIISGEKEIVTEFLKVLDALVVEVEVELHKWQKDHIDERRGQTDQQKFVANKDFIAKFGKSAARRIRNGQ